MRDTLLVNLYAGPGAGKSTAAAYVFSRLKMMGVNAELVTEYAKDKVWEKCDTAFKCQLYVNAKQVFRLSRVNGKVDVMITDSPLLLGAIYSNEKHVIDAAIGEDRKYTNRLDFFIGRNPKRAYVQAGRHQNFDEAVQLDTEIKTLLEKEKRQFKTVPSTQDGFEAIVMEICMKMGIKYEDCFIS